MEKRLLIAIAISILIIIAYPILLARLYPGYFEKQQAQPHTQPQGNKPALLQPQVQSKQPQPIVKKEVNLEDAITTVSSGVYDIDFSNLGGSIKRVVLKKYKHDDHSTPYELAGIADAREYLFALNNLSGLDLPLQEFKFERISGGVIYTYETASGLRVTKSYNVPNDNYAIELELKIENVSDKPQMLEYEIVAGSNIEAQLAQDTRYIEAAYLINDKPAHIHAGKLKKMQGTQKGPTRWAGIVNKYFSILLKPATQAEGVVVKPIDEHNLLILLKLKQLELQPGSSFQERFTLYAGPSDFDNLSALNLDGSLNFGFFGWIGLFLLKVLKFSFKLLHNWGVAIILLTLLINFILYPLTLKSLKAMREMQALQPKVAALREECKNNPQKLNKEVMELYKRHKVNPLGGCLPMLLQMPVFFALYQTLTRSVELKGARFLWIRDLSAPDAAFKLPFSIPFLGNYLNILPILMLVLMALQQKLSSGSAYKDEQQRMMAVMMPIMFGIIFYNLPSGLVLYWVTNTLIMVFVQALLIKPQCTHIP